MSEIESSFDRLGNEAADEQALHIAFCSRTLDCARRAGHLGTCTPTPSRRAIAFDTDRQGEAQRHIDAAVNGRPPHPDDLGRYGHIVQYGQVIA